MFGIFMPRLGLSKSDWVTRFGAVKQLPYNLKR